MEQLRERSGGLGGQSFGDYTVELADDFSYTDSVDNSVSSKQGIRILFDNGARIVYRLSGTGTEGATLRVYIEQPETDADRLEHDPQETLADVIT
jgi:phosphoglucomutase